MKKKSPIRHKVRAHIREGKWVEQFIRGSGTTRKKPSKVVKTPPPTQQGTSLVMTGEEKEDYLHLINDAARKIYVFLRTERGFDHEQALYHLEEYAQWGEIPGVTSPLGTGEPVDNEIRALFDLPPVGGENHKEGEYIFDG